MDKLIKSFEKPDNITELAIDSHAHLYDEHNENKIANYMERDGLYAIVNMAGSIESALKASEISNKFNNIYYMFGLHPYNVDEYNDEYVSLITELTERDKGRLVGLGEIGLDYHVEEPSRDAQIDVFVRQLELAHKLGLPVSLHIRDAHADAITILKENKHLLTNGGIIHCFSGGIEEVQEYLALGFHISISGAVTFKKKSERISILEEAIKVVPRDKLLIETDSPFLCPHPYRGHVNEPKYVLLTAMHIADLLQVDVNVLIRETRENVINLLKLKKD